MSISGLLHQVGCRTQKVRTGWQKVDTCGSCETERVDRPCRVIAAISGRPLRWGGILFGLWGSALTAEELPLTFGEAWQQVRVGNSAWAAARLETERQSEAREATRSLFGPQVELLGRHTLLNDSIDIDLNSIRSVMLALHPTVPSAAIPSYIEPVQDRQFTEAQLTAVWPIYAGGRIRAAQEAATAMVAEAEASERNMAGSLFSELVRRFYGAQLARVVQSLRADALTGLEEHLRQAEFLEREGQIARAERLHAQVSRDEAERELMGAESAVQIAEVALANLMGGKTPITPTSPLFLSVEPLAPLASFLLAAEEQHPALDIIGAKREQAAAGVAVEKGRLKPEVYLFGVKELNRSDLTLLEPDWAAGVGMRVVLFERSDRTHRLAAAKLQTRRVALLTLDLQNNLRTLVEKSYRETDLARRQYLSLDSTLELARENLRVREIAFREGQGTSLNVVDARLTLVRAEAARAIATAEYTVALARLMEASGQPDRFMDYEARATERILP